MSNNGSFCLLHECTFISTACSSCTLVQLLVSSACSLTVNVKLMLKLQHIDFDISDAVVPVLFTVPHAFWKNTTTLTICSSNYSSAVQHCDLN